MGSKFSAEFRLTFLPDHITPLLLQSRRFNPCWGTTSKPQTVLLFYFTGGRRKRNADKKLRFLGWKRNAAKLRFLFKNISQQGQILVSSSSMTFLREKRHQEEKNRDQLETNESKALKKHTILLRLRISNLMLPEMMVMTLVSILQPVPSLSTSAENNQNLPHLFSFPSTLALCCINKLNSFTS